METKHTAGPWQIIEIDRPDYKYIVDADSKVVLFISHLPDFVITEEIRANMSLASKAPDLLSENAKLKESNRELVEALEKVGMSLYLHPDCTENSEFHDLVLTINELIQKAKGGE
jgi:glutamine amidotransferase PdxT